MINKILYNYNFNQKQYTHNKTQSAAIVQFPALKQSSGDSFISFGQAKNNALPKQFRKNFASLRSERPSLIKTHGREIQEWITQFETAEEQDLVFKILKKFDYIDIENARKAYRRIWLHLQKTKELDHKNTHFATLGYAKSSGMMMYLFRQAAQIRSKGKAKNEFKDNTGIPRENPFVSYDALKNTNLIKGSREKGRENLVIVDDMIGDGDALIEYLTEDVCKSLSQYKNIYYVTLIKDPDGEKRVLKHLEEKHPNINMSFIAAEEIHKYDSENNHDFTDEEKQKIKELIHKYDHKIGSDELIKKYSRSKLFLAFEWNCPGNTPMMFNYRTHNWNPLFDRYNGLEEYPVGIEYDFRS